MCQEHFQKNAMTLIIFLISLITPQPSLKAQMHAFATQSFSITYNFSSLEGCSALRGMALIIFILQMFSRAWHIFLPYVVALLIYCSSDVGPALSGHFSTVLLADTIWKKVVTLVHHF